VGASSLALSTQPADQKTLGSELTGGITKSGWARNARHCLLDLHRPDSRFRLMVQAMIRDPACRMAGAVEDGPEDQDLLDDPVGLEGLVGQHAVIADGRAEPAKSNTEQCHANNLEAWYREEDQADDGKT